MKKIFIYLGIISIMLSCKPNSNSIEQNEKKDSSKQVLDSTYKIIADTIIYDVIVKNADPNEIRGSSQPERLKHDEFINDIFELVKMKKVIVYDYFSNLPVEYSQVEQMLKENDGKMVMGKFQFNEEWHFNKNELKFTKEVHSIVFGYESYDSEGIIKGYKPAFKLYFN